MHNKTLIICSVLIATVCLAPGLDAGSATGIVKVVTKPNGATVTVKGKAFGPTPVLIELPVGKHQLIVSCDGYPTEKKRVFVEKDKLVRADVVLASLPKNTIRVHKTLDAGPSTVTLATTPPGLTVFMNGLMVPQPTPVVFDIRAGIYKMTLEQDGQVVYRKTVFARAGKTLALDINVKRRRRIDDSDPWK